MVQMYFVGVVTWLRDLTQLDLETLTIFILTLHFPATTHTVSHQSTIHVHILSFCTSARWSSPLMFGSRSETKEVFRLFKMSPIMKLWFDNESLCFRDVNRLKMLPTWDGSCWATSWLLLGSALPCAPTAAPFITASASLGQYWQGMEKSLITEQLSDHYWKGWLRVLLRK